MITVDDGLKRKSFGVWYDKFINISERIGNFIYSDMDFNKIVSKLKSKLPKPPKTKSEKIPDMISSYVENEKDTRRIIGIGVFSIIILTAITIILYILNAVLNILFNNIAWWVVAIIAIIGLSAIILPLAYLMAKGDY